MRDPNLNEEQLEALFMDFQKHWNENVLPGINAEIMDGVEVTDFDAGRMFENLWLEWKAKAELDYWEAIGLLDNL